MRIEVQSQYKAIMMLGGVEEGKGKSYDDYDVEHEDSSTGHSSEAQYYYLNHWKKKVKNNKSIWGKAMYKKEVIKKCIWGTFICTQSVRVFRIYWQPG